MEILAALTLLAAVMLMATALKAAPHANAIYLVLTHGPLVATLAIATAFNPWLGFYAIAFDTVLVLSAFVAISLGVHATLFRVIRLDIHQSLNDIAARSWRGDRVIAISLGAVVAVLGSLDLFELLRDRNFQIFFLATEEFEQDYMQGVVRFAAILLCVFLIGFGDRWYERVLAISLFILLLFTFVKGVILISALSGFAIRILRANRISSLNVFRVGAVICVAFLGSYSARPWMLGQDIAGTLPESTAKTYFYLVSGIGALNRNLEGKLEYSDRSYVLGTPFLNLFGVTKHGDRIVPSEVTASTFVSIADPAYIVETFSNVNTLYGTLLLYTGSWITSSLILAAIIAFTVAQFALAARLRSRWIAASATTNTSAFALSFFEYFHWHSFFYYIFGMAVMLHLLANGCVAFWRHQGRRASLHA